MSITLANSARGAAMKVPSAPRASIPDTVTEAFVASVAARFIVPPYDPGAAVARKLDAAGLATPNVGKITNIIACPGGDFCSLANAVSIPLAQAIQERFEDLDHVHDIGELDLNISGCINSCGHHHVGHIGILGVDKAGEAWYQVTIGGRQNGADSQDGHAGGGAAIGRIISPSFAQEQVPDVVERLINTYLAHRDSEAERFVDVVARIGIKPFQAAVYPDGNNAARRSRQETADA